MLSTAATVALVIVKIWVVAAMALLIAVELWTLEYALRTGSMPANRAGIVFTRREHALRYWATIAYKLVAVALFAAMVHVFIHLGRSPG